jgi:hypothetical protein
MGRIIIKSVVCVILIHFFVQTSHAFAQNENSDSIRSERIQFIEKSLKQDEHKTRLWWNGWLIGYSAATVAQGAVYFMSDEKSMRQDMALGALSTLLGVANQFFSPLMPRKEADRLALLPSNSSIEKEKKLQFAEELLQKHALCEKNARNWQTHALYTVVNIGEGAITWIGFKRTVWAGLENFALNEVITEAQIWSQPLRAKKDYETYCRKYKNGDNTLSYQPTIDWYMGAYPGGISLKIVF